MAKATKPLGGAAKDKYFAGLIAAVPGLPPEAAARLAELTRREVAQVRVRFPLADRAVSGSGAGAGERSAAEDWREDEAETAVAETAETAPPPAAKDASPAFDPYGFTAVVVLKRQGAEALARMLAGIAEPENLALLAEKQHLGIPPEARSAAELRTAIVAAAEARIADRRAAAS